MERHNTGYLTYGNTAKEPSVLHQQFPLPSLDVGEVYYPKNKLLLQDFTSELEFQKFGAAQFCSFLADTIEVEHCLVIPAITALRRIPFTIPTQQKQDLYKIATDEGFHAEQANLYLVKLESHFGIPHITGIQPPLFLRRLDDLRLSEPNSIYRHLITIINGIVTETRISVELSKFARNNELSNSVRELCDLHAKDEAIHSSQFQALGKFLWSEFDEQTKLNAADFFLKSSFARSLPDINCLVNSFRYVTGRTLEDSYKIVLAKYNADELVNEMIEASKPTLTYLRKLGIEKFLSINEKIDEEKKTVARELEQININMI